MRDFLAIASPLINREVLTQFIHNKTLASVKLYNLLATFPCKRKNTKTESLRPKGGALA